MDKRIPEIQEKLRGKLDAHRYEHTLGVMYTAGALAMAHGEDLDRAMLAGLLHDCAKCYSSDKMLELCDKYGVVLSECEQKNHALIHAKLGAVLAREKYGVKDEGIAQAIRCHTTGAEEMSLLDKIIYVADYIEPHRDKAENLDGLRRVAFKDLDRVIYLIMDAGIHYLEEKEAVIDPTTRNAYEVFKGLISRRSSGRDGKISV